MEGAHRLDRVSAFSSFFASTSTRNHERKRRSPTLRHRGRQDRVWLVAAVGLLHERHIPRGVLRIGILLDGFSLCPPDVEAVRADRGSADGHPVTVVTTFPIIGPMTTTMLPRCRSCSPTFPVTRMINRPRGPPRSTGP